MSIAIQGIRRWAHRNPSRVHLEREVTAFAADLPDGASVLDAGAGDCCYRPYFSRHRYESADFAQVADKKYGTIDHVCDLRAIPVADGRYDAILCTQVLAHMPEPLEVLREFRRVLRPGGRLLLSCPLCFHENEKPYDFFRFTQFGLRHLLEKAGFELARLDWLEGYSATFAYQLGIASRALRARPADYGGGLFGVMLAGLVVALRPLAAGLSLLFARADIARKNTSTGLCKNYIVTAIISRVATPP